MSLPNNSTYQPKNDSVFTSNEGRAFVPQAQKFRSPLAAPQTAPAAAPAAAPVQRQPAQTNQSLLSRAVNGVKSVFGAQKQGSPAVPAALTGLGPITTQYGGQTKYEKVHPGIDVAGPIGEKIPVLAEGTVTESVTGKKQGDKGYGSYVIITDKNGNRWKYSHLSKNYYPVGSSVNKGQYVGEMGNTGSTYSTSGGSGSHLDIRVRDAWNRYVNPSELIGS
jgi:murein DD-endopeptidase MepM/ murein hydrolase activator NlpD